MTAGVLHPMLSSLKEELMKKKCLKTWKPVSATCLVILAVLPFMAPPASAQTVDKRKGATEITSNANSAVRTEELKDLFANQEDFDNANAGFLLAPPTLTIPSLDNPGQDAWDLEPFKLFIDYKNADAPAPSTINPSLYRNAQLNMIHGLFRVKGPIYQVRGYDLSNITFIKSTAGWIVFDPLISYETARAALELINNSNMIEGLTEAQKRVAAVVYSHSHADHYGGVRGLCYEEDFSRCNIEVIAPEGFTEHAVSENVIAGNAMSRRALYMYGALLPKDAKGLVNGGLGQTNSIGRSTLVLPTKTIRTTGDEHTVGGVRMVFQMTPGTEAPAEMNTWFPDTSLKAMWMAENTTNTFHNVLTLRGAQVRDPLKWAQYLDETIRTYGAEVSVKFQSHHWPMWDRTKIVDYWKKQRDLYKYTHDQSVNLMNQGFTGEEISEQIRFPDSLDKFWPNRGYYGTLRHNSRAVYQRYMGWYDGNPSNLNNLPPVDAANKYVAYMGGIDKIVDLAKTDFANGEYRWVVEVLRHAVFANPNHVAAKELLADAYEQLGYQAESGPWRNVYLMGAQELRYGLPPVDGFTSASSDVIAAMTPEMVFDYLAVRLNGPLVWNWTIKMNLRLTSVPTASTEDPPGAVEDRLFGVDVENAVLHYQDGFFTGTVDVQARMSKTTLDQLQTGALKPHDAITSGKVVIEAGSGQKFEDFWAKLDTFELWFNIVTP